MQLTALRINGPVTRFLGRVEVAHCEEVRAAPTCSAARRSTACTKDLAGGTGFWAETLRNASRAALAAGWLPCCRRAGKEAISPRVMSGLASKFSHRLRLWLASWRGPWRARDVVLALLIGPTVLLATAFVTERVRMSDHVLPGIQLDGEDLAGLSAAALEQCLQERQTAISEQELRLKIGQKEFSLHGRDVGARLDVDALRERILAEGRQGAVWSQVASRLARWRAPVQIAASVQIDEQRWAELLSKFEEEALETPREAGLRYENGKLERTEPRPGQIVAREAATMRARDALLGGSSEPLELSLEAVMPKTTRQALDAVEQQARQLLAGPLTMTLKLPAGTDPREQERDPKKPTDELAPPQVTIAPKTLGPALSLHSEEGKLTLALDHEALDRALEPIRKRWEQPAQDASFTVDWRSQISITPSKVQTRLTTEHAEQQLLEAALSGNRRGELEIVEAGQPRITTELAHKLNIKHLVGQFTTQHPCCRPRVKNIHRIADLIDGAVVLPGETFSVNELIGPRTKAKGFVPAPTIVHGEMDDTVGGGVSQFATTIYNAVFNGGYEIIERQAHSYYFKRYPIGHEATLSFPKPDFIFKNDTHSGVLIKTEYGSTYIRVKLYGDNEGRKVRREVSERFDVVEPPIVYEIDDELDPTKTVLVKRGQQGFSVHVSREMTLANGEKKTERRKVVYNPRERIVRVHSCMVPEGEPGYTGEDCPEPLEVDAGAEALQDLP